MKSISTILVTTLLAACAVPAFAADDVSGFYVGLNGRIDQIGWKDKTFSATYNKQELGITKPKTDTVDASDFPEAPMGVGLLFGYRFSPYFAVDGGFGFSADENRLEDTDNGTFRYRMTIRQWQLDGYAYWPMGDSGRYRPFLTAGMAYSTASARLRAELAGTAADNSATNSHTYTHYISDSEINWRLGAGVEVGISDDVSTRLYMRYQPYSFGKLDGGVTLGFDLNVLVF